MGTHQAEDAHHGSQGRCHRRHPRATDDESDSFEGGPGKSITVGKPTRLDTYPRQRAERPKALDSHAEGIALGIANLRS